MSHQVLARKWRPANFLQLVGQEHVQKALVNALDKDRLHHAYLFTGTRGVGKTTIARIFAKCLNCEQGVVSEPCGECSACQEIAEGRFIDLIEVDAASRTKVEDTRELLENVQYAPTRGRYKVYLIDEVHMLSAHSFNALLKTLEEPPPHVKFLLATTDPQKLPATILSRCLQFNLKNMSADRIVGHLQQVLGEEQVEHDEPALWLLAEAARGSMRDALSLTDQAIGFGAGTVRKDDVASMLGTIDRQAVGNILDTVIQGDGAALLDEIGKLAEMGTDFQALLDELISYLHNVAVAQAVPETVPAEQADTQRIGAMARSLAGEDVQIFYQMALNARRDFPYVPEPRRGFEMLALRLLTFRPVGVQEAESASPQAAQQPTHPDTAGEGDGAEPAVKKPEAAAAAEAPVTETAVETVAAVEQVNADTSPVRPAAAPAVRAPDGGFALEELQPAHWIALFPALNLGGVARSVVSNAVLQRVDGESLHFVLDQEQAGLYGDEHRQRLQQALSEYFARQVEVSVDVGQLAAESPAIYRLRMKAERLQGAVDELQADPNVGLLLEQFDGQLDTDSVQPLD